MSQQLRVLTIGHSYAVRMNRAVARAVAEDPGFSVTVATPTFFRGDFGPVEAEAEAPASALKLVPLKASLTRAIHLFRYEQSALDRLIRQGEFDVVHAWEEPYIFAGYQIARSLRVERARFCFRTAQSYVKRYVPPFGFFERTVLQRAQGWIAGASLVREAMLRRNYPERSGRILSLAVDPSAFRILTTEERQAVLAELRLEPPVIGFIGRFVAAKGVDILLQALDRLLDRKWSLLLLGSGERQVQIEQWVKQRGLSNRVKILLAKHEDVPRYVGAMDLLAAPSQTMKNWREQFGRMIIEAFACGVPVIGSNSGEIPHVIGDAGQIVAEADIAAWAGRISELLEDAAERRRLAMLGLKRAQQFSVPATARKYRDYYRWLAAEPIS
jgi:phosphatidyl-myo-inositol dimannoside synthase